MSKPQKRPEKANISISLAVDTVALIDALVIARLYRSRSDAIERLVLQAVQSENNKKEIAL